MTVRYSWWSPPERVADVEAHVRAHLSSVADPGDDPDAHAAAVRVTTEDERDGVLAPRLSPALVDEFGTRLRAAVDRASR